MHAGSEFAITLEDFSASTVSAAARFCAALDDGADDGSEWMPTFLDGLLPANVAQLLLVRAIHVLQFHLVMLHRSPIF